MMTVIINFRKYNKNYLECRTGAYRSSRGKTLIYTEIKLASGLSLD